MNTASAPEVISLGCRLNIAESETIRALLAGERDLVVVNSCAVTAEAVRQTRQAIRKLRRERPHARLLVTGCAADIEREQLAAMPEVDGLVANTRKLDPFVDVGLRADWRINRQVTLYGAAENLGDTAIETAHAFGGLRSYDAPRTLRVGLVLTP